MTSAIFHSSTVGTYNQKWWIKGYYLLTFKMPFRPRMNATIESAMNRYFTAQLLGLDFCLHQHLGREGSEALQDPIKMYQLFPNCETLPRCTHFNLPPTLHAHQSQEERDMWLHWLLYSWKTFHVVKSGWSSCHWIPALLRGQSSRSYCFIFPIVGQSEEGKSPLLIMSKNDTLLDRMSLKQAALLF